MYSIGIDAHKRYSQITIMQENGKTINRCKVNNDRKGIKRALSPYAQDGSKAVLESGWNWGLLYDMFSDCDLEVKVAHPRKVKAIAEAKIKTDKISADILAHLLRADLIPECYAMLIRHEIDRIERFPTSNKLCSYAGLVSSTYSSGGG